jgi:hypothetical protein
MKMKCPGKNYQLYFEMNNTENKRVIYSISAIIKVSLALFYASAPFFLTSCQKVISLDISNPAPQLVVEANISDKPGPYFVKLSRSSGFNNILDFPEVNGALVEISDTSGNSETLTEWKNGIYVTNKLRGVPGQKYKLTIEVDGQTYESVSYMPYPVTEVFLTLSREVEDNPPVGGSGDPHPPRYQVNYEIPDPFNVRNYYRFVTYHHSRQAGSRRVFDDQYHDGKMITDEFGLHDSIDYVPGDTVGIELQNIDQGTYNFFRTLRDGFSGLSFLSASPANPISNISNNGLGYFSAYSVNESILIIPQ